MCNTSRLALSLAVLHPEAALKRISSLTLGALLFAATSGPGVAGVWWFEQRAYHPPLIAGIREAHVSALAYGRSDRFAFQVEADDPRQVWDIDLGHEIPIFGWDAGTPHVARVPAGTWGFGLWIPIDFHMTEDFVDTSNPIINTDYRFGVTAKAQRGIADDVWMSLRVAAGHESTHLGDEFSLAASREFVDTFERINVSWEFLDLSVLGEWHRENPMGASVVSVRIGLTSTLPLEDTYYSTDDDSATESALGPVVESRNWIDPYLGVEAEWEGVLGDWGPYASLELRHRSVYDYHRSSEDVSERRQPSANLIVGLKQSTGRRGLAIASPFVRIYHGVNPHGQFRNQRDFTVYGLGLRMAY